MYVVGGHGYVGSRVATLAAEAGVAVTVVSRTGDGHGGSPALAWSELEHELKVNPEVSVVWLLDGAKHAEADRLAELLRWISPRTHLAFVSSCTVYGDQHGAVCPESTPIQLLTANARLKASCEQIIADSASSFCVLRFGALYGVDDRGLRRDRIEKWVTQAADSAKVTVPDPGHWRGWLHRDQAARALLRASQQQVTGVFNVASANLTFGAAAAAAADLFGATVKPEGAPDPLDYQVDATLSREAGLLDEHPQEGIFACTRAFAASRQRGAD